jgi:hypothetical protein
MFEASSNRKMKIAARRNRILIILEFRYRGNEKCETNLLNNILSTVLYYRYRIIENGELNRKRKKKSRRKINNDIIYLLSILRARVLNPILLKWEKPNLQILPAFSTFRFITSCFYQI